LWRPQIQLEGDRRSGVVDDQADGLKFLAKLRVIEHFAQRRLARAREYVATSLDDLPPERICLLGLLVGAQCEDLLTRRLLLLRKAGHDLLDLLRGTTALPRLQETGEDAFRPRGRRLQRTASESGLLQK